MLKRMSRWLAGAAQHLAGPTATSRTPSEASRPSNAMLVLIRDVLFEDRD